VNFYDSAGLRSIRPMVDPPRVDLPHLPVDLPHLPGRSAPSNLRGGRTGEMGRIEHGGVRGRSAPREWVDLWKKPRLPPSPQFHSGNADSRSSPRPTTIPRRIFELGLTHSHTVATWHWSRLTAASRIQAVRKRSKNDFIDRLKSLGDVEVGLIRLTLRDGLWCNFYVG